MTMDNLRNTLVSKVKNDLQTIPERIVEIERFVSSKLSVPLPSLEQQLREENQQNKLQNSNRPLLGYILESKAHLHNAAEVLNTMIRFISVHIPKIEDGGNFGVSIQEAILKLLQENLKSVLKALTDLNEYNTKRCDLIKFIQPDRYVSETKSENKCVEGAADATTKSNVEKKEESKTRVAVFEDILYNFVNLDLHYFSLCKLVCDQVVTMYYEIANLVEKNIEKLQYPRGTSQSTHYRY